MLNKSILFPLYVLVTITAKTTIGYSFRGNDENKRDRNKMPPHNPRQLETSTRSLDDVRYLALGTSVPMVDGVFSIDASYASLLTPDPSMVTILEDGQSGGPRYPSVCTQSCIQDLVPPNLSLEFDVIIFEYYTRALDGMYDLSYRLRERYPDARFILLNTWIPYHINWFQDGELVGNLQDWAEHNSLEFGSDEFFEQLQEPDLVLRWRGFEQRDAELERIKSDFGAYIRGIRRFDSPKESLVHYKRHFDGYKDLSAHAHAQFATVIKDTVKTSMQKYPVNPQVGTWGDGDECHSWYLSGLIELPHSDNLEIEHDDLTYALSTGTNSPQGSGWIEVNNPFDGPRSLFLSYMASGPPFAMYATTEITVVSHGDNGQEDVVSTMLDPSTTRFGDRAVHVVLTSKVAEIPPGLSTVYWEPLGPSESPFRLTATQVVSIDARRGGSLGPDVVFLDEY